MEKMNLTTWLSQPRRTNDPLVPVMFALELMEKLGNTEWRKEAYAKWLHRYRILCRYQDQKWMVTGINRAGMLELKSIDSDETTTAVVNQCESWSRS
jgi:hypothetical protein